MAVWGALANIEGNQNELQIHESKWKIITTTSITSIFSQNFLLDKFPLLRAKYF